MMGLSSAEGPVPVDGRRLAVARSGTGGSLRCGPWDASTGVGGCVLIAPVTSASGFTGSQVCQALGLRRRWVLNEEFLRGFREPSRARLTRRHLRKVLKYINPPQVGSDRGSIEAPASIRWMRD